jgi:hypothetical protein
VQPGAHEVKADPASYKTPAVVLIVKSGKSLVGDKGKEKIRKRENIHSYLRIGYFVTVNQFMITTI